MRSRPYAPDGLRVDERREQEHGPLGVLTETAAPIDYACSSTPGEVAGRRYTAAVHEQALEELSARELRVYDGHEVFDPDGESLGDIDLIFVDETTGQTEWLGLWNGIPFSHRRIVPIRGGVIRDGVTIHMPYRKDVFERAPSYHEHFLHGDPRDVHITREQEEEAYRLYGIEPLASPPGDDGAPRFRPPAPS